MKLHKTSDRWLYNSTGKIPIQLCYMSDSVTLHDYVAAKPIADTPHHARKNRAFTGYIGGCEKSIPKRKNKRRK